MENSINISSLLFSFLVNLASCSLITYVVYQKIHRQRDYDFSFMILSNVIFFLCFFLSGVEMQLGLALGLFAIFGIIRYRTNPIPIREMTYLFMLIALAVINALINVQIQPIESLIVNLVFISLPFIIESLKRDSKQQISITYDNISLAGMTKRAELKDDLEKRLNLSIVDINIERIDVAQNKMKLTIVVDK
ncbi:MAG: DUF4956 domain-containing protein [Marinifilaceae bacterium]|jgi:Ca2+/Na+ antiporter